MQLGGKVSQFLDAFGFISDPFEFTNAEQERLLSGYFVPPPYFPSVLGEPKAPRSQIVFAPRGGGKTAQRLMIEKRSREGGGFLCVKYDTFEMPAHFRPQDATC